MANFPGNVRPSPLGVALIAIAVVAMVFYMFRSSTSIKSTEQSVSMEELLVASIDLSIKGGYRVKEIRNGEKKLQQESKGKTREGANDPLTAGDTQSHIAIVNGFYKAFPFLNVVSEEHVTSSVDVPFPNFKSTPIHQQILADQLIPAEDITVWVDPLDATQEYTEDLTQYVTVMICVAVKGVPTMGIIHKPFTDETYWAWVNNGHSPNLVIQQAQERLVNLPTDPKIIVSRSHAGSVAQTAAKSFGEKAEVIPAGGAGFKVLSLFSGSADAYIHTTLIKKWDICAGDALLREVSGKMSTLDGHEIDYSDGNFPKVEGGLLASLTHHEEYRQKLMDAMEQR